MLRAAVARFKKSAVPYSWEKRRRKDLPNIEGIHMASLKVTDHNQDIGAPQERKTATTTLLKANNKTTAHTNTSQLSILSRWLPDQEDLTDGVNRSHPDGQDESFSSSTKKNLMVDLKPIPSANTRRKPLITTPRNQTLSPQPIMFNATSLKFQLLSSLSTTDSIETRIGMVAQFIHASHFMYTKSHSSEEERLARQLPALWPSTTVVDIDDVLVEKSKLRTTAYSSGRLKSIYDIDSLSARTKKESTNITKPHPSSMISIGMRGASKFNIGDIIEQIYNGNTVENRMLYPYKIVAVHFRDKYDNNNERQQHLEIGSSDYISDDEDYDGGEIIGTGKMTPHYIGIRYTITRLLDGVTMHSVPELFLKHYHQYTSSLSALCNISEIDDAKLVSCMIINYFAPLPTLISLRPVQVEDGSTASGSASKKHVVGHDLSKGEYKVILKNEDNYGEVRVLSIGRVLRFNVEASHLSVSSVTIR